MCQDHSAGSQVDHVQVGAAIIVVAGHGVHHAGGVVIGHVVDKQIHAGVHHALDLEGLGIDGKQVTAGILPAFGIVAVGVDLIGLCHILGGLDGPVAGSQIVGCLGSGIGNLCPGQAAHGGNIGQDEGIQIVGGIHDADGHGVGDDLVIDGDAHGDSGLTQSHAADVAAAVDGGDGLIGGCPLDGLDGGVQGIDVQGCSLASAHHDHQIVRQVSALQLDNGQLGDLGGNGVQTHELEEHLALGAAQLQAVAGGRIHPEHGAVGAAGSPDDLVIVVVIAHGLGVVQVTEAGGEDILLDGIEDGLAGHPVHALLNGDTVQVGADIQDIQIALQVDGQTEIGQVLAAHGGVYQLAGADVHLVDSAVVGVGIHTHGVQDAAGVVIGQIGDLNGIARRADGLNLASLKIPGVEGIVAVVAVDHILVTVVVGGDEVHGRDLAVGDGGQVSQIQGDPGAILHGGGEVVIGVDGAPDIDDAHRDGGGQLAAGCDDLAHAAGNAGDNAVGGDGGHGLIGGGEGDLAQLGVPGIGGNVQLLGAAHGHQHMIGGDVQTLKLALGQGVNAQNIVPQAHQQHSQLCAVCGHHGSQVGLVHTADDAAADGPLHGLDGVGSQCTGIGVGDQGIMAGSGIRTHIICEGIQEGHQILAGHRLGGSEGIGGLAAGNAVLCSPDDGLLIVGAGLYIVKGAAAADLEGTGQGIQGGDDHGAVDIQRGREGGPGGADHAALANRKIHALMVPGGDLNVDKLLSGAVFAVAGNLGDGILHHQQTDILRGVGEIGLGIGHVGQVDGVDGEALSLVGAVGPVQAVVGAVKGHGLAVEGVLAGGELHHGFQLHGLPVHLPELGAGALDGIQLTLIGALDGVDRAGAQIADGLIFTGEQIQPHQHVGVVHLTDHVHGVGGGIEGHVRNVDAQVADIDAVPQTGNHGNQVVACIHGEDIAARVLGSGQGIHLHVVAGQRGDLRSLGIDGDPAVEGVIGVAGVHDTVGVDLAVIQLGQVVIALEGDLVGGLVCTVVAEDQQEFAAQTGDVQLHGEGAVAVVHGNRLLGQDAGIGGVCEEGVRDVDVFCNGQHQVVAAGLGDLLQLQQLGSLGVDGDGDHDAVTVEILGVGIVVAGGGNGQVQAGVVGQSLAVAIGEAPGLVIPGIQVGHDLTIGGHEGGLPGVDIGGLEVGLTGQRIGEGEVQGLGVAHQGDVHLGDVVHHTVAVGRDDVVGGIVEHIAVLVGQHTGVGVEAQHPVGTGQVGPDDIVVLVGGGVGVVVAPEVTLIPEALIQDGSGSPVAVEAQEGQAQVDTGTSGILCIDEALDIDAVFIVLVHPGLVGIGQLDGDLHALVGVGGDLHGVAGEQDLAGQLPLEAGHELGHAELHIVIHNLLGQQGEVQLIRLRLVGNVVDIENEVVNASLGGVIAQLGLGLVLALDGEVGLGCQRSGGVNETRALLAGGCLQTGGVGDDGVGGGHHQGMGNVALLGVRQIGVAVSQVLQHQGGNTGQLGGRHGGAGHQTVLAVVIAGVHVAADGGDLRLQLQGGGNAPGGEQAHLTAVCTSGGAVFSRNGQNLGIACGQRCAGGHGNGDTGHLAADAVVQVAPLVGHLQADGAGLVVVDDHADGTGLLGVEELQGEVDLTAGNDGDLAGQIQTLKVGGLAQTGDHHILQLLTGQGTEVGVQTQGIGVAVGLTLHGEVGGEHVLILRGGHGDGAAPGGGRADHGGVGMAGGVLIGAPDVGVGALGIVTGGDGQDGVEILHAAIDGIQLGILGGEAGGSTQGHIDDVHIQQQGVLNGSHQVILIGTAVGTEDLHDNHLGIGGNADDRGALAGIGGGDTGDMGAVVALVIVIVGGLQVLVHIVEGEGNLGAAVQILCGGGGVQLAGVQLGEHLLNIVRGQAVLVQRGLGGEGGVIQVEARIDDGDLHALAGVAQILPDAGHADHVGSGGGVDGLALVVNGHQEHGLDTGQLGDLSQRAERHIGGNGVGQVGELIADIQLRLQHLAGDAADQLVLLSQHGLLLSGGNIRDGNAAFGQRRILQDDEGGNHLIGGIELSGLAELPDALGQLCLQQVGLDVHLPGSPFALGSRRRLGLDGIFQGGDVDPLTLSGLFGCSGVLAGNILVLSGGQSRRTGNSHVHDQAQRQQHRQHTLEIHVSSSFFI